MSESGFGELLARRARQALSPSTSPSSSVGFSPSPSTSISQNTQVEDSTTIRYKIYSDLWKYGNAMDKQYVKSAVNIQELAQVLRKALPNSPRAIALEYLQKYTKDNNAIIGLMREILTNEPVPDWLRQLISIAIGEQNET